MKIKTAKFISSILCLFILPAYAMADEIKAVFAKDIYRHAQYGIHVADTATGETLYAMNGDRLFYPASLTKLFVAAAALSQLGRDFKFETTLFVRGTLTSRGELRGDLMLVPTGDVFFSALDFLAKKVKAYGVREIGGEVIVDDRLFPPYQALSVVNPGHVLYIVSPATVATYQTEVSIRPTRPGRKARLDVYPATFWPTLINDTLTVEEHAESKIDVSWVEPGKVLIAGKIAISSEPIKRTIGISDPASFLRFLFIKELQRAKIKIKTSPAAPNPRHLLPARANYKNLSILTVFQSPPLAHYVRQILTYSHNPGADALVLALGRRRGTGTMEEGMVSIREFLQERKIDLAAISLGDGAGISPANSVTPEVVTSLLNRIVEDKIHPDILDALPVLGVSGTLKGFNSGENPVKGKMRAKTGTLNQYDRLNNSGFVQCKSLAGYIETASGRRLSFCVIVNNAHAIDRKTKTQVINLTQEIGEDLVRIGEILYRTY